MCFVHMCICGKILESSGALRAPLILIPWLPYTSFGSHGLILPRSERLRWYRRLHRSVPNNKRKARRRTSQVVVRCSGSTRDSDLKTTLGSSRKASQELSERSMDFLREEIFAQYRKTNQKELATWVCWRRRPPAFQKQAQPHGHAF